MAGETKPAPRSLSTLGTFRQPPSPPPARVPYGPPEAPPPAPLAFLAPWLEGAVDALRGGVWGSTGAGDTAAAKTAELLSAGLPLLPLKALGFFSRVDKAVDLIPAKGAHPNKVASLLKSNASAEELAYRNVPEFLAGKGNATVTRADLAAHLAAHPAPVPVVKTRGGPAHEALRGESADLTRKIDALRAQAFGNRDYQALSATTRANAPWWAIEATAGGAPERTASARAMLDALPIPAAQKEAMLEYGRLSNQSSQLNETFLGGATKFEQYTVPGGEAYRETLVTLPGNQAAAQQRAALEQEQFAVGRLVDERPADMTRPELDRLIARFDALGAQIDALPEQTPFRSGHFDEPNILVHTRANERTLPTGERGRFVEEVQSDWHQKGKKHGYQTPGGANLIDGQNYEFWNNRADSLFNMTTNPHLRSQISEADWPRLQADLAQARENRNRLSINAADVVPDAPFKESWPDLGLKQQVLETAADPTAEWIGVTGGATQAARYDLSKQIDRVIWRPRSDPDIGELIAYDKNNLQVMDRPTTRAELADHIGKEAAERLLAQSPSAGGPGTYGLKGDHILRGLDLQVGGEGMRHFYDQVLPKRLEKIVKPFGGTVERGAVPAGVEAAHHGTRAMGEAFFDAAPSERLINGKLPVGPNLTLFSRDELGEAFVSGRVNAFDMPNYLQDAVQRAGGVKEPAWIARLTPEMKARILKEGLPLMSLLPLGVLGNYGQPPQEPAR